MKIGFLSLGCPKNLVDSEVMMGLVEQAGHELTTDAGDAEVLVVNTCAFIDSAKQESIDAILEMARFKHGRRVPPAGRHRLPRASGIATSCARRFRRSTSSLGTGEVPEILRAIEGHAGTEAGATAVGADPVSA